MKKLVAYTFVFIALAACNGGLNSAEKEKADSAATKKSKPFVPREKEFYPSGAIQMAGKVEEGKRQGPWASWFENGNRQSEAIFRDGEMDGAYSVFWENGQFRIQGQWKMGKEIGTWYFFDEKGDTSAVKKFD